MFGKTHSALVPAATGSWRGQVALCGGGTLVLAAQKRAVHVGQPLQEMPVEGSAQSLVRESGTPLRTGL